MKEDVEKLLDCCEHPRERFLVSLLFEGGLRLGEVLGIKLKDIKFEESFNDEECWIKVSGKTGPRSILLFDCVHYLKELLDIHPYRTNAESYLFLNKYTGKPFTHEGAQELLKRLGKKAGMEKPINPQHWRHSSATQFARYGYTEEEAKIRYGWSRASKSPARYFHLTEGDLAKRMRAKRGIVELKEANEKIESRVCYKCKARNELKRMFCKKCFYPLTDEAKLKFDEAQKKIGEGLIQKVEEFENKNEMLEKRIKELEELIKEEG